jgi:hypothetical protein
MDDIREFLEAVRQHDLALGHLRGLLHVSIGRTIARPDGTVLSTGSTWRELANLLKQLRFDKDLVRELGADPEALSPRDRQRFWYAAITLAKVDSAEARAEADRLARRVADLGFVIGPAPSGAPSASHPAPSRPAQTSTEAESAGKKKKKK